MRSELGGFNLREVELLLQMTLEVRNLSPMYLYR